MRLAKSLIKLSNLRYYLRRVDGHSMEPILSPGSVVVALGWLKPRIGDIVIAKQDDIEVIKKVSKVNNDKLYLSGGDGDSSHNLGWVSRDSILARVKFIFNN